MLTSRVPLEMLCGFISRFLVWVIALIHYSQVVSETHLIPNNPFYVDQSYPKLITHQWVGEEDVDAVVILAIDDLRTPDKFESYLRPILERLKKIDGRAPVSIYCNALEPDHEQFQTWLKEGLSLEVHTLSHPCPLLAKGDFQSAVDTVLGGIDILNSIPNNRAVAYRMPCCDSINSPSPRFYSEIFPQTSTQGNYLEIDSSIMCLLTSEDTSLPSEWVLDENKEERFTKYVPFPSFTTTIENYPYPYVINNVCWEFPALAPSDWEAQNLHGVNNEKTVDDWKRALDLTVLKKGVFTWIFHPHGWIRNDQVIQFIDYAADTYGDRVKFLTFREASERLSNHLLKGQKLRNVEGEDAGVRLLDVNQDGHMDVILGQGEDATLRVWHTQEADFKEIKLPFNTLDEEGKSLGMRHGTFWPGGPAVFFHRSEQSEGAWVLTDQGFQETGSIISELQCDGKPVLTVKGGSKAGLVVHDLDGDGVDELIVGYPDQKEVLKWNQGRQTWDALDYYWPEGWNLVDEQGRDAGVRFVDINEDGFVDLIKSDEKHYAARIFLPEWILGFEKGWSRLIMEGDREDKEAIPAFVREGPYRDNGAWFAKGHVWVQNEDTAHLPDLVERKSFREILLGNRPQPKEVDEALASFELDGSFDLRCVASEPLVEDPVAFEWSADGYLWVAEMRDYPMGLDGHGRPGGRIKRLKDVDGDGVYDESVVFLDKLPFPSGLFPWGNGLWVSAAPLVFFAADLDGDGRADVRRNMFSGFGEGNQQHRVNGFTYGLDHWLYGANGDSGGEIRSLWSDEKWNLRGKDFKFNPATGEFRAIEGQTQFGRTRDDWGNWFGNNNPNWLWHYHLPDRYSRQSAYGGYFSNKIQLAHDVESKKVDQIARSLQRFNDIGMRGHVTSACSPHIYRDSVLFEDGQQHAFISEPVHNLVRHFVLKRDGVSFKAERPANESDREFLASRDPWFRPTMIKTGPDGNLYIADMYRLVIEHTEWIPDDVESFMNTRAGTDKGRIYAVIRKGEKLQSPPSLDHLDPWEWVNHLGHSNGWVRDSAQRLLVDSNAVYLIPEIRKFIQQTDNTAGRLQGLYILNHFDALNLEDLNKSFVDPHLEIRRNGLILSEHYQEPSRLGQRSMIPPLEPSLRLLKDPSEAVKHQALLSIGATFENWKVKDLVDAVQLNASNPPMRQAILTTFSQYFRPVYNHVAACDQCFQAGLLQPLMETGLRKHQQWTTLRIRQTIQSVIDVDKWDRESRLQNSESSNPLRLAEFLAAKKLDEMEWRDSIRVISLVGSFLRTGGAFDALTLSPHMKSTLDVIAKSVLVGAGDFESTERVTAFEFLWRTPSITDWGPWLIAIFSPDNDMDESARLEVLKLVNANSSRLGDINNWYGQLWNERSLKERRLLLALSLQTPSGTRMFLDALNKGYFTEAQQPFSDASITHEMEMSLRNLPDPELKSLSEEALQARRDRLGLSANMGGSIQERFRKMARLKRGRIQGHQIFSQNCSQCHRFQGEGTAVGPDLDALTDRSGLSLLEAILNPSSAIEEAYRTHTLTLIDGMELTVLIQKESDHEMIVTTTTGETVAYAKAQIQSMVPESRSLMPDGWGEAFSDQNIADLIGYLQSSTRP